MALPDTFGLAAIDAHAGPACSDWRRWAKEVAARGVRWGEVAVWTVKCRSSCRAWGHLRARH
eukprot:11704077-Alexandrium_andersonii.AAC.1